MAANMPMAASGHLMIQQQQQAQQNQHRQMQHLVLQQLATSQQMAPPGGWQTHTSLQDRLGKTMNLISNTILALPTAESQRAYSYGVETERKAFLQSNDKSMYDTIMAQKLNEMVKRRQANAPDLQNQINADAARQAQLQAQQQQVQQQQMLMNQMAAARGMGQPAQHGGFQHLQHPMQVSQIPQQQPQGMNAGMANATMLQNRQGQRQFQMQMAQQRAPGAAVPQNLAIPRDISQLNPQEKQKVLEAANRLYAEASDAQKHQFRQIVSQKMPPNVVADYQATGRDPALLFYQNQAFTSMQKSIQARLLQQRQGMPPGVIPQVQPGQVNPSMMNALGSQPGVGEGQLFPQANMESIRNEQQMGLMAQQNGQLVVPVSLPGRNPTPGPMNGLPAQPAANNGQVLGQTPRPPQVQPGFMQPGKMNPAAVQARAQASTQNLMQGQPGGLGGPPPNSQSPAMNTLTAPMRQPPVPMGTGQPMGQNNQPGAATLNPNFSHQTNARPIQGGLNMNNNMNNNSVAQMLATMNPETRASMNNLDPAKVQGIMEKWSAQARNPMANNGLQGPKPQPQMPGMFGMPGQLPAGSMGNTNQFAMANNMMQPGAVNPAPTQPTPQQLASRLQLNNIMHNPQARLTMESLDVPPTILEQLRAHLPTSLPAEIRKWGALKQFLQNQNVSPQMQQQLLAVQVQQFRAFYEKKPAMQNPAAAAAAKQQVPMPGSAQLSNAPVPANAPAPQPQQNQVPPLPPNITVPPVTQQDLEVLRKTHPRAQQFTDEQLLQLARKMKEDQLAKKFWQAQKDSGRLPGQAPTVPTSQHPAAPTPVSAPQNPRQPPQQKPTPASEADALGSSALKNARPPQPSRPALPNNSPATAKQSLKRPNSDDPSDAAQPVNGGQRPSSQPANRLPQLTPEQVARLTPEQKAKYEQAMRNRFQAIQATEEEMATIRKLGAEENRSLQHEQDKPVQMSPEEMKEVQNKIQALMKSIQNFQSHIGRWYHITKDDAKVRLLFRARFKMGRQYADGEAKTKFHPVLTVSRAEVERFGQLLDAIFKEYAAAASGKQQPAQPAGEQATQMTSQLSSQGAASNLPNQAQAPKPPQQNRPAGRSGQPPAAPTSAQPPFMFGNQSSPIGTPTYFGKPDVTVRDLKAPPPPRKKAKRDPELPSPSIPQPGGANASPQSKVSPPDIKRQPAPVPEPPKPQPKNYPCPEPDCEYHSLGFPTEEARNTHHQEEHIMPREDPFKFVHDSLGLVLALESDENSKAATAGQETTHPAAPPMNASLSRQGQTPASRPDSAATPMSRDASMRRQGSAAGKAPESMGTPGKSGMIKAGGTPKLVDNKLPGAGDAPMGLLEDPWASSTIDPQSLFSSFGALDSTRGGTLIDMSLYRSSTPNDTPESSKDSGASEPNSDISESMGLDIDLYWQPMDADILLDLNQINMEGLGSLDGDLMNETMQFSADDMNPDFSKPFQFDSSLYLMDPT